MEKKTLFTKIGDILGSARFWMLTLTAGLAIATMAAQGGVDLIQVLDVVKVWLLAVAGVGTLDSVAERIGSGKTQK